MKSAALTATSTSSLSSTSYIYRILRCDQGFLATICSDDSLHLLDPNTLQDTTGGTLQSVHEGVTCLANLAKDSTILCTAGRDGVVRLFDTRSPYKRPSLEFRDGSGAAYLSLCCNADGPIVGTEYANHQASILLWDTRSPKQPKQQYIESHNDDVTVVHPRPTSPNHLLSGSTDGLINICNTSIPSEEDALVQITNHGSSINHANFLSPIQFFGLSHDEQFSIYQVSDPDSEDSPSPPTTAYGDLREKLSCEYVVDVLPPLDAGIGNAILGAGSHSKQQLDLTPLRYNAQQQQWSFDESNIVRLPGAHGEDIVRSMCFAPESSTVFTAGEDGKVRAWRIPDDSEDENVGGGVSARLPEAASEKPRKKHGKRDSISGGRYKPY